MQRPKCGVCANTKVIATVMTILLTVSLVFHFHVSINKGYIPNDVAGYYIRFLDLVRNDVMGAKYPLLIPLAEGLILGYPIDVKNIDIRYYTFNLILTSASICLMSLAFNVAISDMLDFSVVRRKNNFVIFLIVFIIFFTSVITIYFKDPTIKSFVYGPFSRLIGAISIVLLISTVYINNLSRRYFIEKLALIIGIFSHPVAGMFAYLYILLFKLPKLIKTISVPKLKHFKSSIAKIVKKNLIFIILLIIGTIPYVNLIFETNETVSISPRTTLTSSMDEFLSLLKPYIIPPNIVVIAIIVAVHNMIKMKNKELKAIRLLALSLLYLFVQFHLVYHSKPFTIIQYSTIIIYWFVFVQIARFVLYSLINCDKNEIIVYALLMLAAFNAITSYTYAIQNINYYSSVYSFYGTSIEVIRNFNSILKSVQLAQYNVKRVYILGTKTRWYIVLSILNNYEYFEAYSYSGFLCVTPRPLVDEIKNMLKGFVSVVGDSNLMNGYVFVSLVEGEDSIVRAVIFNNLGAYIPQYYIYFTSNSRIISEPSHFNVVKVVHNTSKLFFKALTFLNTTSFTITIEGYNYYSSSARILTIVPLFNHYVDMIGKDSIEVVHRPWFIKGKLLSLIHIEGVNISVDITKKYIRILSVAKSNFHCVIVIKLSKYCPNLDPLAHFLLDVYRSIVICNCSSACGNGIVVVDSSAQGNIYRYIEDLLLRYRKGVTFLTSINKYVNIYLIHCK